MPDPAAVHRLATHVTTLATDIGERNVFLPGSLAAAETYLTGVFRQQGYEVNRQSYEAFGVDCANLEVTCRGQARPDELLLLGAHYDSVQGSPGADDNASGVAALLELGRRFAAEPPAATVRLVAFVNEEPPFFFRRSMGSMVYARAARRRGDRIRLMVSLEMLGCYSDEPGSQRYPPLFRFFYPDRGNFVAFVSDFRSRRWLKRAVAAFKAGSDFPVQHVAMSALVPGIGWSDHLSFWRQGFRALMVTDTAFYRNRHYHTAEDTPDKVDLAGLARVTDGLEGAFRRLAGEL